MGGPQLWSHQEQQAPAAKLHGKREKVRAPGRGCTHWHPAAGKASSVRGTSASVLCRQLQSHGRWEDPSHRETCRGKETFPPWGTWRNWEDGQVGQGGEEGACAGRQRAPHQAPSKDVPARWPGHRWSTVRAASPRSGVCC